LRYAARTVLRACCSVCCSVLQYVAVRCSVLQRAAVCCPQRVCALANAMLSDTATHITIHGNTVQHTAAHCHTLPHTLHQIAPHCNKLQHTATYCTAMTSTRNSISQRFDNTLQITATRVAVHFLSRVRAHKIAKQRDKRQQE